MSSTPLLDHFVYTAPVLHTASRAVGEALGLELTPGGAHPASGTANTLAALGPGVYLEVLGPDATLPRERLPELGAEIAVDRWSDIATFAVASGDIDCVVGVAASIGLDSAVLPSNSRRTPDGRLLQWRGLYVFSAEYAGLVPFFIDWGRTPHPSTTSVQGAELASAYVVHPRPEPLREIYAALGVRVPVVAGSRPAMIAHLRHGPREFVLVGEARGLPAQRRLSAEPRGGSPAA